MTAPNNPYPALARAVDPTILHSIRQASQATSTDFGLLMAQASRESGFRADAKSSSSSAAGLFQFVDSTWLDMVRRFGAKYGAGQLAQQISQDANGKPVVGDSATRKEILALRHDPSLSASLAGEYTKLNQTEVERSLGHKLSRGDLYMAHFLGAGGASSFLKAVETKGNTVAANLLPDAAAANQSIFYDANGRARTVGEIYHTLSDKIEKDASAFGGTPTTGAQTGTMTASERTAAVASELGLGGSTGASSIGRPVDWSGIKLSEPVLAMLNVVALAALKMSETDPTVQKSTPQPLATPRERHSI
jgi:hypothetical protein